LTQPTKKQIEQLIDERGLKLRDVAMLLGVRESQVVELLKTQPKEKRDEQEKTS
jgi:predicted XRE-type DNA-binding protein